MKNVNDDMVDDGTPNDREDLTRGTSTDHVEDPVEDSAREFVDWEFAKATGRRLVSAGPKVSAQEAADVVNELRDWAIRARQPVAETARLHAPPGATPVLVVDRSSWIDANVDSMRAMLEPVIDAMLAKRNADGQHGRRNADGQHGRRNADGQHGRRNADGQHGRRNADGQHGPGQVASAIGGKVTGGEAGGLLAFLASKVLGQVRHRARRHSPPTLGRAEHPAGGDRHGGRTHRLPSLGLHARGGPHRVQFSAVPWLRDHLIASARGLALDMVPDPDQLGARLEEIARRLPEAMRSGSGSRGRPAGSPGAAGRPGEGHRGDEPARRPRRRRDGRRGPVGDPVCGEDPGQVPATTRGTGSVDRLLRKLLGLEAKMRQYRDGAVFVRTVTDKVAASTG